MPAARERRTRDADYEEYINSDAWRGKRESAFDKYGRICQKCQATNFLDVHHLTYTNFKHEQLEDLRIVCRPCHQSIHQLADTGLGIYTATLQFLGEEGYTGTRKKGQRKFGRVQDGQLPTWELLPDVGDGVCRAMKKKGGRCKAPAVVDGVCKNHHLGFRCHAITAMGKPCRIEPEFGNEFCNFHGPKKKAKGRKPREPRFRGRRERL